MRVKDKKGFTIVELIAVIGILSLIVGIFAVNMVMTLNKNRTENNERVAEKIRSAGEVYVLVNPDEIDNLYNGYGFVDIPIGDLRNAGLLDEDLKDEETGERISDDEKVRVILKTGDIVKVIYPIEDDADNKDAYKLVSNDLYIKYDQETDSQTWCSNDDNVFSGMRKPDQSDSEYSKVSSKLYFMDRNGKINTTNYFDTNTFDLKVSSCNVNPKRVGTYSIVYSFKNNKGEPRTKTRKVLVTNDSGDIISFTVEKIEPIMDVDSEGKIVKEWPLDKIKIYINEKDRNGNTNKINPTIEEIESTGYTIKRFSVDKEGKFIAVVSKLEPNSDGSIPKSQNVGYEVIPHTYKVTFDTKGGSKVDPKMVRFTEKYGKLPTPTRPGYTFKGWSDSNGTPVDSETTMKRLEDHTLYAKWEAKKYIVSFDPNGASTFTTTSTVTFDSPYGFLPSPTRTGYDFLGWYTSKKGGSKITADSIVKIPNDHTLYARWDPKQFTITFVDTKASSISPSQKTVTYGSTYGVLPTPYYSYRYKRFNGWYTSGGTHITSSSTVNITSDQTLYGRSYNVNTFSPSNTLGCQCVKAQQEWDRDLPQEEKDRLHQICIDAAVSLGYSESLNFCSGKNPYYMGGESYRCKINGKILKSGDWFDEDGNVINFSYGSCS